MFDANQPLVNAYTQEESPCLVCKFQEPSRPPETQTTSTCEMVSRDISLQPCARVKHNLFLHKAKYSSSTSSPESKLAHCQLRFCAWKIVILFDTLGSLFVTILAKEQKCAFTFVFAKTENTLQYVLLRAKDGVRVHGCFRRQQPDPSKIRSSIFYQPIYVI